MARKADVFAAEGSLAGKLRRRRDLMESGEPEAAQQSMADKTSPADGGDADGGSHDMPDMRYKRGYRTNQ